MRAAICERYGPPEVLRVAEVPTPIPQADQILIRIHASAVNTGDTRTRALRGNALIKLAMRLMMGWSQPKQPILGTVFSGTVESAGAETHGFAPGDEVYGCTPGLTYGGHAEYIVLKPDAPIAAKPGNATHEEAASIIFGGTTALYFLEKAKAEAGESILVYGASGAVGTAATQIASLLGLHVTAVAGARSEALVKELGADTFIDYQSTPLGSIEERFDIVFETVGKASAADCKRLLKPEGRFITVASMDVAKETKEQLDKLAKWYEEAKLVPVIDRQYTLDQIQEAHRYVDTGHKRGSVTLVI